MIQVTAYDAGKYLERYSISFKCDSNPPLGWENYWLVFGDNEDIPPATYAPEDAWNPDGRKVELFDLNLNGLRRVLLQVKMDIDIGYYSFDDLSPEVKTAFGRLLAESMPQDQFMDMIFQTSPPLWEAMAQ